MRIKNQQQPNKTAKGLIPTNNIDYLVLALSLILLACSLAARNIPNFRIINSYYNVFDFINALVLSSRISCIGFNSMTTGKHLTILVPTILWLVYVTALLVTAGSFMPETTPQLMETPRPVSVQQKESPKSHLTLTPTETI